MFGSILSYDQSMKKIRKVYHMIFGSTHVGTRIHALHVLKVVKKIKCNRILDAGCGGGLFSLSLTFIKKIIAIDIDFEKIKNAQKLSINKGISNIDFVVMDLEKMNLKQRFDLILCVETLEHIENDVVALKNLYCLLKKGGYAIFHTPRDLQSNLFPKLRHLKIGNSGTGYQKHKRDGYSLSELTSKLEQTGFSIIGSSYTRSFWGKLAWELDTLIKHQYVKMIFFPVFLLLIQGERFPIKDGNGILVVCKKM
jgi:2-polyprenyl-3-methyl-5-hydroxy-6-metoxy-1,4-benzoquinol methylase